MEGISIPYLTPKICVANRPANARRRIKAPLRSRTGYPLANANPCLGNPFAEGTFQRFHDS